ncbi:DUF968 domain-containing protein [Sinirhodobacter populi]|uniref:DUF968 domain-containing protein n=1 Tax=Paenirhodobacter populi TaxID=2306993 RepID=A0A443K7S8_9RHOB|nr:Ref family recombination enhancement nuclease [Sinirhodobacter populi]RWR28805.1 DUF968 domain-containing protein [Sinirhodobacter populi]
MSFVRKPLGLKQPKPGAAEGKRHMARVAELPCVCCGVRPVHVHHVICGRFSQRRAPDTQVIPLCPFHHTGPDGIHTRRAWWVETFGEDTDYLPVVADMLAGEWVSPWII